jgi:tetratricopeptide (TPR) repeat protein
LGAEQARGILSSLDGQERLFSDGSGPAGARWATLPFYKHHLLIELTSGDEAELAFALHGTDRPLLLSGVSDPIHQTNEAEAIPLTDATVGDYLRFFFFFVRGDSGAFVLVESQDEIEVDPTAQSDPSELRKRLKKVRKRMTPLTVHERENGGWTATCTVAYTGSVFNATLEILPDGTVEMLEDDLIAKLDDFSAPEYPPLAAISDEGDEDEATEIAAGDEPVEAASDGLQAHGGGGDAAPQVFICYRRDDMRETARRLAQSLRERFGEERVFFDLDDVRLADVWADTIAESIRRSDVLLAVIGHRWLELLRDHDGRKDQVRIEIETALQANVKVLAVPVYGAALPSEPELPESIAPMLSTQELRIDERHYENDIVAAAEAIERIAELKVWGRDGRPASARQRPREDRERLARAAMTLLKEGFSLVEPDRGTAVLERVIEVFDEVIRRFGGTHDPSVREQVAKAGRYKAYALYRLDRGEEALKAYDDQVFRYGAEPGPAMREHVGRALVNKGFLLAAMQGCEHDAIAVFNQAILRCEDASDPVMHELVSESLFNKAMMLDQLGLHNDELAVYDELLRRFGNAPEPAVRQHVATALVARGITLVQLDRREEGLAAFDEVISRFADAPEPALREQVTRAIELIQEPQ